MTFSLVSRIVYVLLSMAIGVRLLGLWRRSRQLPELLMGLAAAIGGLGATNDVLQDAGWLSGSLAETLSYYRTYLLVFAAVMVVLFAWRVFRPEAVWAGFAAGALSVLTFGWALQDLVLTGVPESALTSNAFYVMRHIWMTLCYAWPGYEALRYCMRTRKRLKVGLDTDPLPIHRALMLSVSLWAVALIYFAIWAQIPIRLYTDWKFTWQMVGGELGIVRTVGLWLAFFPPVFYRRWLRARFGKPVQAATVGAS